VKPYVICHMVASIDGRTLISRWRPTDATNRAQFAELHERLAVDAWLVGRATGAEYARGSAYPSLASETYPREPWFARRDAVAYGVVLDAQGKIGWGRGDIDGDPIVVVLSEQVSDSHLAGLRRDGVSYLFAGKHRLDLAVTLESLNRELGITRLEINGGGITNGSFLRAGLIDEISVAIYPVVDGAKGARSVFDSTDNNPDAPASIAAMALESSEVLPGGAVWLRYRLQAG
jgi:riboflavin biosynthesis pyrimidine reductase